MDFYKIKEKPLKDGRFEIYPDFIVGNIKDVMVRGKNFYAIWDDAVGLWSTNEIDVARIVDNDLKEYVNKNAERFAGRYHVRYINDFSSGIWDDFKRYITKFPDNSKQLNEKIIFSNTEVKRNDYASKRLSYPLQDGAHNAYEKIMSTLYDESEREKLEWAIGSIISGDAKKIQKFIVLYGNAGAGKSTILNIIQMLFDGYYCTFDAKELTNGSSNFSTDVFSSDPLVAIQHDGDLSGIKDNSLLNSIVSHEEIIINEKFKGRYASRANCLLFMATNKPVKITDAKAGIIRRLIDVKPSGRKLPPDEYDELMEQIPFELGPIAYHCLHVYEELGKTYYNSYKPLDMMYKTDPFFNFVEDSYDVFKEQDGIQLKQAYAMYKEYCNETGADYKLQMYKFREELKNYFDEFLETYVMTDGLRVRSYYKGFNSSKFDRTVINNESSKKKPSKKTLVLDKDVSLFDELYSDCPAQYASAKETPKDKWEDVTSTLSDIDTSKVHYIRVPLNHIVIDFDLKDENGNKSEILNLEAASKFPPTYAEFSKGGAGVHLHYIYDGDVSQLSRVYDDNIEIKVFNGNSSLRRRLSKCNDLPIATINSGLPLRAKEKTMVNFEATRTEKGLRAAIEKNLRKEVHPGTKPSVDFIYKILNDAYESGLSYDVSDMRPAIMSFAFKSTHQADYCVKLVGKMPFTSEKESERVPDKSYKTDTIIFYDVEVFPNLFLVNWKKQGKNNKVVRMINPTPDEIGDLLQYKLVGFNCRRYDNHIMYARFLGYTNEQLYKLSQRIVSNDRNTDNCFFREAYNLSYTDVYDYAAKKQSLKKWEIELGIHHQELGLPWDKPVPEELWSKVAEYCDNDVIATEAVWDATQGDFIARQILADVTGMTVNDTTNTLSTRFIFGNNRHPQDQFNYRFMGEPSDGVEYHSDDEFTIFGDDGKPIFPGYEFKNGVSTYMGEEVGEGGYVYAEPGMYANVVTFDVASMHPSSIIAENLFGDEYTARFKEILDTRLAIKHKDFDLAKTLLNGALAKYLKNEKDAKALAQALKIVINSVYGLTSAKFDNPFRDSRNRDNIVAKRGALFMVNLKHEVQSRGYKVAHIKTDSIKIVEPDENIISFVMEYGKKFGYNFEVEHKFEKICLVNNAVYIAKLAEDDPEDPGKWTATGTQFAVPYVFKTLFSHEKIEFADLCETKSVTGDIYLDINEGLEDVSELEKLKKLREKTHGNTFLGYTEPKYTRKEQELLDNYISMSDETLDSEIAKGHNYHFVGKVGSFCPIKPDCGGGILYRFKDGKYSAATGTKGYRWLEAEMVQENGDMNVIDKSYYQKMVDEAVTTISEYGDFEWFAS